MMKLAVGLFIIIIIAQRSSAIPQKNAAKNRNHKIISFHFYDINLALTMILANGLHFYVLCNFY